MHRAAKWVGPALFVVTGIVGLGLSVVWGHVSDGLWLAGGSAAIALGLALGGRSELVRTVRGDPDERSAKITAQTSNIVLNVLAAGAVVGAVVEQAHGVHSGPWTLACAIGGALYLATFLAVRAFS